jgi:hypothetical protein
LVERLLREQEVAGSNPVTPTNKNRDLGEPPETTVRQLNSTADYPVESRAARQFATV